MTANPLLERQPAKLGRVTKESLEAYAERLNRERWVLATGKPYFVNKRTDADGFTVHFLDRNG